LRDLVDDSGFRFKHTTAFDAFVSALEAQDAKADPSKRRLPGMGPHVRLFFDECIAKEAAAHEESERRQRKREERYNELLEDYYYRSDHIETPWADAEVDMRKRSAFLDLKDPNDRRNLFEKHIASLAKKMGVAKAKDKADEGAELPAASSAVSAAAAEEATPKEDGEEEDGEEKDEEGPAGESSEAKKEKKHKTTDSEDAESTKKPRH
jgi:hypothetical protein